VEDNGPGIPVEHHKDVFKRFYRMNDAAYEEGCGLGLSIVKEIAERHDTTVSLAQPKGHSGCIFSISFHMAGESKDDDV
jgi:two-component system sensor histidine kinase TctE